jgi:hypothetical protein
MENPRKRRKDNRGGARPGSGRPINPDSKRQQKISAGTLSPSTPTARAKTLGQDGVERMTEAAGRFAKMYGVSIEELFLHIAYGTDFAEGAALTTRLKALERVREAMTPKIVEGGPTDTRGNPPAELPARRPHPEKVH